ncbi:MAG: SidA/IucD/PvdA family monooxygenase [Acidobacteriota bacterium]
MEPIHHSRRVAGGEVYDIIGVGFGAANLALAVAMAEAPPESKMTRLFLETKPRFVWHPGMLLPQSRLQVTVLKDLITVENPCSRFTFLNFLKDRGRLYDFLNLRTLYPTRIEFNDYLTWVAEQFADDVRYGQEVLEIQPISTPGVTPEAPQLLEVTARDRATRSVTTYRCRHLVLATGGEPAAPPGFDFRGRPGILHSHQFLDRLSDFPDREAPYRFVVVGGGQSAGELFEYLMDHYPNADVTAAIRRFAYKPVDESDFMNRIFFPEWVDYTYRLPEAKRQKFFEASKDVNYAAIDSPLIRRIYDKLYQQKVEGRERCRVLPFLELESLEDRTDGALDLVFRDVMQETPVALPADGLVLCTGYTWRKEHPLLDALAPWFEHDAKGGYRIERDYRIATRDGFRPRVYLQGYCEATHGISETVLSLLPVRAQEILRSLSVASQSRLARSLAITGAA